MATENAQATVDGTALLAVRQRYPADQDGCYFEVAFGGASSPVQSVLLDSCFNSGYAVGTSPGVLHVRPRRVSGIKEPWLADVGALLKAIGKGDEKFASTLEGASFRILRRAGRPPALRRRK